MYNYNYFLKYAWNMFLFKEAIETYNYDCT